MHKTYLLLVSAFVLLLVGAGCNNTTKNPDNSITGVKTTSKETTKTPSTNIKPEPTSTMENTTTSELTLSGQATPETGTVNLKWSAPQELKDKVETWRLLYGKDANPTFPASWLFERGPSYFEKVWSDLPSGPGHIRLCAVIDDKCEVFSNDLEVDIK